MQRVPSDGLKGPCPAQVARSGCVGLPLGVQAALTPRPLTCGGPRRKSGCNDPTASIGFMLGSHRAKCVLTSNISGSCTIGRREINSLASVR